MSYTETRMSPNDAPENTPRRLRLVFLAYLLMYPLPWLEHRPTGIAVIASALGIAGFLALYFRSYGQRTWARIPTGFAVLAIGFALHDCGGVWSVFAVYAASMVGFARPARLGLAAVATIVLCVGVFGLALRSAPWDWGPAVFFGAIIGVVSVFLGTMQEHNAALAAAREESRRLSVVAERERIARDLHDVLGHTLTLVAIKADLARKLIERDPAAARREVEEIHTAARAALADVRADVSGMRSTTLAAELSEARRALADAGIALTSETTNEPMPPQIETALAYVIREAATNVIRHSGARACRITLVREGADAALAITDDGRGGAIVEGHGLTGMRQRLAALRGALELEADGGMHLRVRVPLSEPAA